SSRVSLPPKQVIRAGQHLGNLELFRFRQPAMENLEEEITFEIDEDRFGVFVTTFCTAASQCFFAGANVNVARPFFFCAETLDGDDQITRYAGVISRSHLFERTRPGATLNNHASAAQPRHMRRTAKMKRVEAKRDHPRARKRTKVFA